MSIFDGWKAREQEKKLENSKQKVGEKQDLIEFQKLQKKIREKMKTKEELDTLKDFMASGILSRDRIENILSGENLNTGEIHEILEKISQLQDLDRENKILPRNFRITQQEYLEAITNFDKKVVVLQKIDMALEQVYLSMGGGFMVSLFSFLSYNLILSKEAQEIQGGLIDIKNDIINTKTL